MSIRKIFLVFSLFVFSFKGTETVSDQTFVFPDFNFVGMFDKNYKLTDLKGSYVLVNFWASWNEESRKMQLKQVPIYSKYRDQTFKEAVGFEIVSVSIDTEEAEMRLALKKDRLNWANHCCDSKGWDGQLVKELKLKGIPSNFLLNEKGIVIAQNIDADSLENLMRSFQ
jgi:thiol-disulfide isomerase/thioredoxin